MEIEESKTQYDSNICCDGFEYHCESCEHFGNCMETVPCCSNCNHREGLVCYECEGENYGWATEVVPEAVCKNFTLSRNINEKCQFCNSPSKYISYGYVIAYECGTIAGDQLPRTLICAIEWALSLKKQLAKSIRIEHGTKGRCPTCFAYGTFDIKKTSTKSNMVY